MTTHLSNGHRLISRPTKGDGTDWTLISPDGEVIASGRMPADRLFDLIGY